MKKIYIGLIIVFAASVMIFISAFFLLDSVRHKIFYYNIYSGSEQIGTIKIDRFTTEDKIIYKSLTSLPFEPLYTEYRARLVLDKNHIFENFTKERFSGRVSDQLYIENFKKLISFISRVNSKFTHVTNIPVRKNTFVFEQDSPVTYFPIIENYDFLKGRSQGFYSLLLSDMWQLPPKNAFIIITSINNEFIKVDSKKIRSEKLILKLRDHSQASLWVTMPDKVLARLEIPSKNITIRRTFSEKAIKAVKSTIKPDGYSSKNVSFDGKNVVLNGTLTTPLTPEADKKFPAIIMIPGQGAQSCDYQGLFVTMADYLSKNGYIVLRFDKRNFNQTSGQYIETERDLLGDIEGAMQFLKTRQSVDIKRVYLISHAEGARLAVQLSQNFSEIKGVVLMSPVLHGINQYTDDDVKDLSLKLKWTQDYENLVKRLIRETNDKIADSKNDRLYILGKKCFLENMRAENPEDMMRIIKELKVPVMIIQGKNVNENFQKDFSSIIYKALPVSDLSRNSLAYYAYLGNFLSDLIKDTKHRSYYRIDPEVVSNIKNWLNDNQGTL